MEVNHHLLRTPPTPRDHTTSLRSSLYNGDCPSQLPKHTALIPWDPSTHVPGCNLSNCSYRTSASLSRPFLTLSKGLPDHKNWQTKTTSWASDEGTHTVGGDWRGGLQHILITKILLMRKCKCALTSATVMCCVRGDLPASAGRV
jgi:hypothetical protein